MQRVIVKEIVKYGGHSLKSNGNVDLSFEAMYDQITSSMEVLQMLNNDVKILCKFHGEKSFDLGWFRVKNVDFNHDGTSKLKFNSININVELDNLNKLVTDEIFEICMKSIIMQEEGDEDN